METALLVTFICVYFLAVTMKMQMSLRCQGQMSKAQWGCPGFDSSFSIFKLFAWEFFSKC
jgi:hypothetical protein